jgi:hypothetical protein
MAAREAGAAIEGQDGGGGPAKILKFISSEGLPSSQAF